MAINVFPNNETWNLISSSTPSGVSSVNFTSLSGYKKYLVALTDIGYSSSSYTFAQINGVTTSGYYAGDLQNINPYFLLQGTGAGSGASGFIIIDQANQNVPKQVLTSFTSTSYSSSNVQMFMTTTTVSSILIATYNNVDFNSGTVALYGVA